MFIVRLAAFTLTFICRRARSIRSLSVDERICGLASKLSMVQPIQGSYPKSVKGAERL